MAAQRSSGPLSSTGRAATGTAAVPQTKGSGNAGAVARRQWPRRLSRTAVQGAEAASPLSSQDPNPSGVRAGIVRSFQLFHSARRTPVSAGAQRYDAACDSEAISWGYGPETRLRATQT